MGGVCGLVCTDQGGVPRRISLTYRQRNREEEKGQNLRAHQNKTTIVLLNDLLIVLYRSVTPDLLSDDMAMERERRQWEREKAEDPLDQFTTRR